MNGGTGGGESPPSLYLAWMPSEPVHASCLSGNNAAQACIWPSTAAIMHLCIDLQGVKDDKKRRAEERQRNTLESCNPKEAVAAGS